MPNLHLIINTSALAYNRISKCPSVNGVVTTDFNIITYDYSTDAINSDI